MTECLLGKMAIVRILVRTETKHENYEKGKVIWLTKDYNLKLTKIIKIKAF